jgi:hypothetical protein
MDKATARKLADALTWARIWSVIPITVLAWYEMRWWVFGLYIAASLTDLFDGYFGRRATPPDYDIDLDGRADDLFAVMTLAWIWMLFPEFWPTYWLPWIPVLVTVQIYLWVEAIRRPALVIPHFEFGRKGMVYFCVLLPVLIAFGDYDWYVHSVFLWATAGKLQLVWYVAGPDANDRQNTSHA